MYLIQGVFFQNQQWLGTRMVPIEGMVAVIEKGLLYSMFTGTIYEDSRNPGQLTGGLVDHYGNSDLSDVELTDTELRFTKKYQRRADQIEYVFRQNDSFGWIGTYVGPVVGSGVSRCVLTRVGEDFFDPFPVVSALGLTMAHKW